MAFREGDLRRVPDVGLAHAAVEIASTELVKALRAGDQERVLLFTNALETRAATLRRVIEREQETYAAVIAKLGGER